MNGEYLIGKNLEGSGLQVPTQYSPDENEAKQGDICQDVQCSDTRSEPVRIVAV
jgi:hypothetical protein